MIIIKFILSSLNAKFIHSSLALNYLRAFCQEYMEHLIIEEFTINNSRAYILQRIFECKPDVLCFSCYIWNIDMTLDIVNSIKKIMPELIVILGGPEVSYNAEEILKNSRTDFIILGEGEETFRELAEHLLSGIKEYESIRGLVSRRGSEIITTRSRAPMDFNKTVFPYISGLEGYENRILYYETSRGCPFSCQYCLSSSDRGVRFLDLERVFQELKFFLTHKVRQVKLVDRTFNCNPERSAAIWKYLADHDNGVTNFHFEISGDMLDEESFAILKTARVGLFQFEIGIQSTNEDTLGAINRRSDPVLLLENIKILSQYRNIHIHLDLIAGLPGESYRGFAKSFEQVYAVEPDRLQLGFLKVLKGTGIYEDTEKHGIVYEDKAPYEVLYTDHIRFTELTSLHEIEEMLERYYNNRRFRLTLRHMVSVFQSAFVFYQVLSDYWKAKRYHIDEASYQNLRLYSIMHEFCSQYQDVGLITDLLRFDLFTNNNEKNPPEQLDRRHSDSEKSLIRGFYKEKETARSSRIEGFKWNIAAYVNGTEHMLTERDNYVLFVYNKHRESDFDPRCSFEEIHFHTKK